MIENEDNKIIKYTENTEAKEYQQNKNFNISILLFLFIFIAVIVFLVLKLIPVKTDKAFDNTYYSNSLTFSISSDIKSELSSNVNDNVLIDFEKGLYESNGELVVYTANVKVANSPFEKDIYPYYYFENNSFDYVMSLNLLFDNIKNFKYIKNNGKLVYKFPDNTDFTYGDIIEDSKNTMGNYKPTKIELTLFDKYIDSLILYFIVDGTEEESTITYKFSNINKTNVEFSEDAKKSLSESYYEFVGYAKNGFIEDTHFEMIVDECKDDIKVINFNLHPYVAGGLPNNVVITKCDGSITSQSGYIKNTSLIYGINDDHSKDVYEFIDANSNEKILEFIYDSSKDNLRARDSNIYNGVYKRK